MRKVHLITFGCQMNKLDSELAAEALADAGHILVADEAEADLVIVNACSVREHAERRVLSRLARFRGRRESENGFRLGLMGCFAERDGEALLAALPYLDFAVGTRQFFRLPEIVDRLEDGDCGLVLLSGGTESGPGVGKAGPRRRHRGIQAFVSVMRGCDNRCSYCVVPDVRGGEISRPPVEAAAEVRSLALAGAREITLLGQNIDAYGRKDGWSLAGLLRLIDAEVPDETGLVRLRFVTSHPRDVTRELAGAVDSIPRVARHFHMPAQSGSDRVLFRMRRGYDRAAYEERLAMLRKEVPGSAVASDFIVGFPGETERDFLDTVNLVETAGFQNIYVFKYSPRPGTPAARDFADDVPDEEKRRRNRTLLAVQERIGLECGRRLIGTRQLVLAEGPSPRDPDRWIGRTGENRVCVFPSPPSGEDWRGCLVLLKVESATHLTLFCRPAHDGSGEAAKAVPNEEDESWL
ncbi:MAG: tRNA (N6-isopentenyl adenosine(37)-C2)-methylthiotransferase MiaB [Planctomycetota bacterium]|jgi:tRNA-2-methylthio-N6-dimethylallyladenosine synthase|nr:tRNA (N6-isopentenyl adenosine(37)-C2)-methylthiotransferase MiaB [Planctomycetota bacterium]